MLCYMTVDTDPGLRINSTRCTVLLGIFISLLYMCRATLCPSSGELTVSMRHWYLSLCVGGVWSAGWIFATTSRSYATHTEWQIPASHRYSKFSWWWVHGCPKHVEKRNKYIKQNCAPSWICLQDCSRMHGQQNIKWSRLYTKLETVKYAVSLSEGGGRIHTLHILDMSQPLKSWGCWSKSSQSEVEVHPPLSALWYFRYIKKKKWCFWRKDNYSILWEIKNVEVSPNKMYLC